MKNSKLIALVLKKTGLEREELEHIVTCASCDFVPDIDGGAFRCPGFKDRFWGEDRHPSHLVHVPTQFWQDEILYAMRPGLRFEEFVKKEEKDGNEEA